MLLNGVLHDRHLYRSVCICMYGSSITRNLCMQKCGMPVLHGAASTLIAALCLSGTTSYFGRAFFFGLSFVVLFGGFQALWVLPTMLTLAARCRIHKTCCLPQAETAALVEDSTSSSTLGAVPAAGNQGTLGHPVGSFPYLSQHLPPTEARGCSRAPRSGQSLRKTLDVAGSWRSMHRQRLDDGDPNMHCVAEEEAAVLAAGSQRVESAVMRKTWT